MQLSPYPSAIGRYGFLSRAIGSCADPAVKSVAKAVGHLRDARRSADDARVHIDRALSSMPWHMEAGAELQCAAAVLCDDIPDFSDALQLYMITLTAGHATRRDRSEPAPAHAQGAEQSPQPGHRAETPTTEQEGGDLGQP